MAYRDYGERERGWGRESPGGGWDRNRDWEYEDRWVSGGTPRDYLGREREAGRGERFRERWAPPGDFGGPIRDRDWEREEREAGGWGGRWRGGGGSSDYYRRGAGYGGHGFEGGPAGGHYPEPYYDYGRFAGGGYGPYGGETVARFVPREPRERGDYAGEAHRASFVGRGPKGWKRSDERIREEVSEALARHPDLDPGEVEVRVENGEVTLTGVVEDRRAKRLAEDIADDVFGVDDVHNELKIRHGFLAGVTGEKASDRESARTSRAR